MYKYQKISFSSASFSLLRSVEQSLKKLGFNVRITKNRKELMIENQSDVRKYMYEVGTHNSLRLKQIGKDATNGKSAVC